jgi:hypothetical protein
VTEFDFRIEVRMHRAGCSCWINPLQEVVWQPLLTQPAKSFVICKHTSVQSRVLTALKHITVHGRAGSGRLQVQSYGGTYVCVLCCAEATSRPRPTVSIGVLQRHQDCNNALRDRRRSARQDQNCSWPKGHMLKTVPAPVKCMCTKGVFFYPWHSQMSAMCV